MGYADLPPPAAPTLLRVLRDRLLHFGLPKYASITYAARANHRLQVEHQYGFRDASPPSTRVLAGPVIVTLVWPQAPAGYGL